MKAVRVHKFGGLDAMIYEEAPQPEPGPGQMLVKVKAAGVGPWDAWVREGKSGVKQTLPLILGSDLSGVIEQTGSDITGFKRGDEVFGVTNASFTGAYAEFSVAEAGMVAYKPERLDYIQAASVPVVACTAWQMVFDYGQVDESKRVLIHGGAGNVGAYAVQLAKSTGAQVISTAYTNDVEYVRTLGADLIIDTSSKRFEEELKDLDVVIDTIGGDILDRSFEVLHRGGVLVSSAAMPDKDKAAELGIKGIFLLVKVTTEGLTKIAGMIDTGRLAINVGEVLALSEARAAHELLAGKPHKRGKIVLTMEQ